MGGALIVMIAELGRICSLTIRTTKSAVFLVASGTTIPLVVHNYGTYYPRLLLFNVCNWPICMNSSSKIEHTEFAA